MPEKWFQRVQATQDRTGFRTRATVHKPGCLCATCHAEMFERAAEEPEEFDDTAAWDRGHDQWVDEQTGVSY